MKGQINMPLAERSDGAHFFLSFWHNTGSLFTIHSCQAGKNLRAGVVFAGYVSAQKSL